MTKHDRLLEQILHGRSDANIAFGGLVALLESLGFEERIAGSHHIFRHPDVDERINLQRDGNKAKPYQVKQERAVILRYRLGADDA